MKIFVLGAGRMGSVVAMDLARSNNGVQIGIGDIDIERAKSVAKNCDAEALKVDLMKADDLIRALKGYDVVVNASWYEFNLQVMKACFRVGCDYNDLGGPVSYYTKTACAQQRGETSRDLGDSRWRRKSWNNKRNGTPVCRRTRSH